MANIFYLTLILIVAVWAIFSGFHKGITRQLASLLGMAFGAVASRILTPELSIYFQWVTNVTQDPDFNNLSINLVCSISIYIVVYWIFELLAGILRRAVDIFEVGMFNRIIGAFFSLLKNLMWVSIFYNLLICFSSGSGLLRYERANDGNLVAAVMSITPALLGCYGAEDFAHFNQLKEAKTISCNFNASQYVILTQG